MGNPFKGKVYLLVTGATRGIGKSIAIFFGSQLENQSKVLLLARNFENLKRTADGMSKNLSISFRSVDFSSTSEVNLRDIVTESLKDKRPDEFDHAIIVHCASMADFSRQTTDMADYDYWHRCFQLNMFSPAVLNGIFMNVFNNRKTKKHVINISSYWALKPDKFVGSYCAAAAAKNMYFKVFALENPEVTVLNYLPGIVETDMFYDVLKETKNQELKDDLKDIMDNRKFISASETAEYLTQLVKIHEYKSGDFIDYQDNNSAKK